MIELESTLQGLQFQLAQQEQKAKAEIEQLQESYSSLEDQKVELVQKLEENLGDAQEKQKEDEDALLRWQGE